MIDPQLLALPNNIFTCQYDGYSAHVIRKVKDYLSNIVKNNGIIIE